MKTIKVPNKYFDSFLTLLDLAQFQATPSEDVTGTPDKTETETLRFVRKLLKKNGVEPCDHDGWDL